MKGNKGKEVTSEGARHEVESQVRPMTGDKRKTLSKNLDLDLPNRRSKKTRHGLSQVVKSNPPSSHQPAQVFDVDSSTPVETTPSQTPSKLTLSTSSQPSQKVSSNIIENESLAWERFNNAVTDDINTCYDMSFKDFEHSDIHDLFKVTSLPRLY